MLIKVAPILKTTTIRKLFYLCVIATRANDESEFVSFELFKIFQCIFFILLPPAVSFIPTKTVEAFFLGVLLPTFLQSAISNHAKSKPHMKPHSSSHLQLQARGNAASSSIFFILLHSFFALYFHFFGISLLHLKPDTPVLRNNKRHTLANIAPLRTNLTFFVAVYPKCVSQ